MNDLNSVNRTAAITNSNSARALEQNYQSGGDYSNRVKLQKYESSGSIGKDPFIEVGLKLFSSAGRILNSLGYAHKVRSKVEGDLESQATEATKRTKSPNSYLRESRLYLASKIARKTIALGQTVTGLLDIASAAAADEVNKDPDRTQVRKESVKFLENLTLTATGTIGAAIGSSSAIAAVGLASAPAIVLTASAGFVGGYLMSDAGETLLEKVPVPLAARKIQGGLNWVEKQEDKVTDTVKRAYTNPEKFYREAKAGGKQLAIDCYEATKKAIRDAGIWIAKSIT